MEAELGEERQCDPFQPRKEEEEQPLPDGPITVGMDGGYVRAAHQEGWFEVIAGRSVVAFRRAEGEEVPPTKCLVSSRPMTRNHAGDYGGDEVAGHAGTSAGGIHVGRR